LIRLKCHPSGLRLLTPLKCRPSGLRLLTPLKRFLSEVEIVDLAEEGAENYPRGEKDVPQRLKPYCKQGICGTGKPVPLSKTDFFQHPLKSPALPG